MLDVVLEHVVLHLDCGELLDKAGVAGRIENDVADAEEREARRRGQKQAAPPMSHLRRLVMSFMKPPGLGAGIWCTADRGFDVDICYRDPSDRHP